MRYGWHGARAVAAQLNEWARRDVWQSYMAAVEYSLGVMLAGLGGKEYPLPSYYEMTNHTDEAQDDARSGAEIITGLIDRLRGEEYNGT